MRIAVFHNLGSGGAKRALYDLTRSLIGHGHTIDAFVPDTADETYLPLQDLVDRYETFPVKLSPMGIGASLMRYRTLPFPFSLGDIEASQRQIADAINATNYDVVFVEQDRYTTSPFLLKYVRKPTLYYCQQPMRENDSVLLHILEGRKDFPYWEKRLRKYLIDRLTEIDRENFRFSQYVVTNSYFSRENILRTYGFNAHVSYLGIDSEMFVPGTKIEEGKDLYLLSVGACIPKKGYDFIIRSLGLLPASKRPKFVIVCDQTDLRWEAHLTNLASQCSVTLKVHRQIPDKELVGLYQEANLLVYAPYLEPFGLVPLEAMSCGTPVVAVKEGGVRETVLDGETGLLTERDERSFATAIEYLIGNPKERDRLGKRGPEIVRSFWTLEHACGRLLTHLQQVIDRQEAE